MASASPPAFLEGEGVPGLGLCTSALPVLLRPGVPGSGRAAGSLLRTSCCVGSMQHVPPTAAEGRAGTAEPEGDGTSAPLTCALRLKNKTEDCAGAN